MNARLPEADGRRARVLLIGNDELTEVTHRAFIDLAAALALAEAVRHDPLLQTLARAMPAAARAVPAIGRLNRGDAIGGGKPIMRNGLVARLLRVLVRRPGSALSVPRVRICL